jgi:uncharacterized membrane protein YuzA (DUF378 family)
MMVKNMGKADRLVRAFLVAPLAVIGAVLVGPGSLLGILLFVVAAVMLGTAAIGSCPLYRLVGLKTCPMQKTTSA